MILANLDTFIIAGVSLLGGFVVGWKAKAFHLWLKAKLSKIKQG